MRYLNRLLSDLKSCSSAGVIPSDLADKIYQHISERHSSTRVKGITWIFIIAGLFIATGISLLVAHNWDKIPSLLKIAVYLAILTGAGVLTLRWRAKENWLEIPGEVIWFFLPIVGIGLYAQIFQLSGDPIKPFLVWLVLTLPLAWASSRVVMPTLHTALIFILLLSGNFDRGNMISLVGPVKISNWLITVAMLLVAALQSRARLLSKHRVYAVGLLLIWVLNLLLNDTPLEVKHDGVGALALLASSLIWVGQSVRMNLTGRERHLPWISWIACLYAFTFYWHFTSRLTPFPKNGSTAIIAFLCLLAIGLLVVLPKDALSSSPRWNRFGQALLVLSFPVTAFFLSKQVGVVKTGAALANLLLLAGGLGLMMHGALQGIKSHINWGVAILFLILVTRFIDTFGTLLEGGLAFIIAGLLMGGLAYGLYKSRKALLDYSASKQAPL